MKIHIDTDVIIDMISDRDPWADDSAAVLNWAKQYPLSASVAWHSLANLFYLTTITPEFALELNTFLKIPEVGNQEFQTAMKLDLSDPEDAMQISCALLHQAECIVTRNHRHYRKSPIMAISPKAFLAKYAAK